MCIYIIVYIYICNYRYIYIVYIGYTPVDPKIAPSAQVAQESGPKEPAERWLFLCPRVSDPPPWKPQPWHDRVCALDLSV